MVVIFLTDADDSTANISPEEMAKKLRDFKGGRSEKVSAYGALVRKSDADTYKDWGLRVTPKYHPECFDMSKKVPTRLAKCAGGFGPERIEQLIALANVGDANKIVAQHTMSIINKNFGSDLAKIGANITETTLQKDIVLHTQPALDRATGLPAMRVRYGTQEELSAGKGQLVPNARKGGWLYDPEAGQIHLAGDIDYSKLQHKEGSRFAVDMIPVLPE
ncbi:MAG: hypothetical protein EOP06_15555 [Proteobacteria bacterium]|nr:MAG: hypothetical protein EOP06_15555 [Pseudomonadota bacterium]